MQTLRVFKTLRVWYRSNYLQTSQRFFQFGLDYPLSLGQGFLRRLHLMHHLIENPVDVVRSKVKNGGGPLNNGIFTITKPEFVLLLGSLLAKISHQVSGKNIKGELLPGR